MKALAPIVDGRDRAAVLAELQASLPGYTPEWWPQTGSAGSALMRIFSRYMELLIAGLDGVPERSFLAFLDTVGVSLLPAQPARVPLVFNLMANSPVDPILPANSQVAAPVQPVAPSPLLPETKPPAEPETAVFATTQAITLLRGRLAALYSLNPGSDEYAEHTGSLTSGFTVFDGWQPVEHILYLGHGSLFALAGDANIRLSFNLGPLDPVTVKRDQEIVWEYLSQDGWLPLVLDEDRSEGLTKDDLVILRKECGPDAKEETIDGHTSYWLRGRLLTPLPPQGDGLGTLPVIDTVRAQVGFTKAGLLPEAAFTDSLTLDTNNTFYPFGKQPVRFTTFYLASEEVFQRRGARVTMHLKMASWGQGSPALRLAWEYYDGANWQSLEPFDFVDTTDSFTAVDGSRGTTGSVSFRCPPDWDETTVNGVKNYWLRVRIDAGDYGHPIRLKIASGRNSSPPTLEDSTLQPPAVAGLSLQYRYQTERAAVDHCLAFNNFVYSDHSHACRWLRQTFQPFEPVPDRQPAVHFGFDRPLPAGLISMYLQEPAGSPDRRAAAAAPTFVWEYYTADGWNELGVLDETASFRRSGLIQFIGPPDAIPAPGLGGDLYWLRARLKQGERLQSAPIAGLWLNAVWATHRVPVSNEVLGQSDGNPDQTFYFRHQHVPVLEGEVIEVREWAGRGVEWETIIQGVPEQDVRFEYDLASNTVRAVWVRWHERPHLFNSGPIDRHYVLERAAGILRMGNNRHGDVPPAGARITASYNSGGGLGGNLPAGAISELRTGVPYLESFSNPVAAAGGANTETVTKVRARGPQSLRHRDRGVSAQDFEWLAHEASPAVARARCLAITGPEGKAQRGWVTLIVIPYGQEPQPQPTPELMRRVQAYLGARIPATVSGSVRIRGPIFILVGIAAEIVPLHAEESAQVEARILTRLNDFLHPLSGGPDGLGWSFGQPLYLSQVASLIEETKGVDYALQLRLHVNGQMYDEHVAVAADALVASGNHEIKLTPGEK